MRFVVNGRRYRLNHLRAGEERLLDVAEVMVEGETNMMRLTAYGPPGGTVTVFIHD